MREILDFLKDILMIKEEKSTHIGLSQFKIQTKTQEQTAIPVKAKRKELKLSELMRGTAN